MLYLIDSSHRFDICPVVNRSVNEVGRIVWSMDVHFVANILNISRIMITNVMNGSHTSKRPVFGRDVSNTKITLLAIIVMCGHADIVIV